MLDFYYITSNPNTSILQRMNNERRDMYHDLVYEHRKLSNEHSRLCLDLSKKDNPSRHNSICRIILIAIFHHILLADIFYCVDTYFSANILHLQLRSKSPSCSRG
jgi:hypothetical protein